MATTLITANMSMILPVVLGEPGPTWAADLNTALSSVVDAHDHSSGKGVQITPAGLNINVDLPFGSNNATALRSVRYSSQGAPLSGVADLGCVYTVGNDLFFNDGLGNQIRLTSGGQLNATALTSSVWATQVVSTNVAIAPANTSIVFLIDTTAARTITLPAANSVTTGRYYVFVDKSGSSQTNAITVTPAGSDTILGVSGNATLSSNRGQWVYVSDGSSNWNVLTSGMVLATGTTAGGIKLAGDLLATSATAPLIGRITGSAGVLTIGSAGPSGIILNSASILFPVTTSGNVPIVLQPNALGATGTAIGVTVAAQDAYSGAGATAASGAAATLRSGAFFGGSSGSATVSGSVAVQLGTTAAKLAIVENSQGNYSIGLGKQPNLVDMPNGTGSLVTWLPAAITAPTGSTSSTTGTILYSTGNSFAIMPTAGTGYTLEFLNSTATTSSGAAALFLNVRVNGTNYKIQLNQV